MQISAIIKSASGPEDSPYRMSLVRCHTPYLRYTTTPFSAKTEKDATPDVMPPTVAKTHRATVVKVRRRWSIRHIADTDVRPACGFDPFGLTGLRLSL